MTLNCTRMSTAAGAHCVFKSAARWTCKTPTIGNTCALWHKVKAPRTRVLYSRACRSQAAHCTKHAERACGWHAPCAFMTRISCFFRRMCTAAPLQPLRGEGSAAEGVCALQPWNACSSTR